MNNKLEDVQKVTLWMNLRYYLKIFWETLRTTSHFSKDSCYPGWYLNQASAEYKSQALLLRLTGFIMLVLNTVSFQEMYQPILHNLALMPPIVRGRDSLMFALPKCLTHIRVYNVTVKHNKFSLRYFIYILYYIILYYIILYYIILYYIIYNLCIHMYINYLNENLLCLTVTLHTLR